jgi:hypothetical protein
VTAVSAVLLAGCSGPGDHLVGSTLDNSQITPGLWHSRGADGCYWARRDAVGNIIANSFSVGGPQYVEVKAGDAWFSTSGCFWVQADGAFDNFKTTLTPAGQFVGDGQFRVGVEIPAGNDIASQPLGCYWARLSSFDGTLGSIIQNNFNGAVTIQPGDVEFESEHCGIWTKVG